MNAKTEFQKKQELKFKTYILGPYFSFILYFFWFYFFTAVMHIAFIFLFDEKSSYDKEFVLTLLISIPTIFSFVGVFLMRNFRKRISLRGAITFSVLLLLGPFLLFNIYKSYGLEFF